MQMFVVALGTLPCGLTLYHTYNRLSGASIHRRARLRRTRTDAIIVIHGLPGFLSDSVLWLLDRVVAAANPCTAEAIIFRPVPVDRRDRLGWRRNPAACVHVHVSCTGGQVVGLVPGFAPLPLQFRIPPWSYANLRLGAACSLLPV